MCALEFTVPLVDSELGGSVIYEEWKGNLAAADAAAGAWLERARSLGPGPDLADAMLARGVVDVLTGRPRAAVEHLAEVERVVPHDPGRLVRAITYTGLARYLDVNCFPSLIGMAGAEFESRSAGFMQEIGRRWERLGALLPAATPDVGLESSLVNGLLCNLLTVRSAGADPEILSGDAMQTVLQASLSVPDQFVTPAFQAGVAPKYLAFAHLAAAGLCHRLRQVEQAGAILGQASALYAQAGDKAGVALCHMTEGDWSCAPASSPAVLNRFMKEGTQSSALSGAQEAREAATDPAALAAAASSYDQAGQAFAAARAPRGVAAVALRRGYLAMRSGDHSAAERWAAEAGSGFLAAGDALGRWVAEAHLALASVGVGRPENTDAAAAIGAWGASEGSFSWALGLGLLFARQGRGWLVSAGDVERSLACSRLAVATFRALGAEQNEAQALVDQGETYAAVGESIAAMDLYEQGVARFEQAIRRLSADPETGGAARPHRRADRGRGRHRRGLGAVPGGRDGRPVDRRSEPGPGAAVPGSPGPGGRQHGRGRAPVRHRAGARHRRCRRGAVSPSRGAGPVAPVRGGGGGASADLRGNARSARRRARAVPGIHAGDARRLCPDAGRAEPCPAEQG